MKIMLVGIGPGDQQFMTPQAKDAIQLADVIVGYNLYIELIADLIQNKQVMSNGMKKETERCRAAIDYALLGKTVAVICSGDAGVYGMAGIVMELAKNYPEIEIEVIPGITAACSAAAVLGAPLTHDFAVISLSDLLTPWDKIEKRLCLASDADFVICLYNPSSKKRHDYLEKAVKIMLNYKKADVCCGYVRNIGRDEQSHNICTLAELSEKRVDMFTTVIVGNSQTVFINNKMVTPRGYKDV